MVMGIRLDSGSECLVTAYMRPEFLPSSALLSLVSTPFQNGTGEVWVPLGGQFGWAQNASSDFAC